MDQREYFESGMLQRSVERRSPLPTALPTDWEMVEKGFNEAGVMMRFTIRTEREYQEEIYYANGIKGIARHLLDNHLQGRFEELDSLGRIRVRFHYAEGVRDGRCDRYDESGKSLFSRVYHKGLPESKSLEQWEQEVFDRLPHQALKWAEEMLANRLVVVDSTRSGILTTRNTMTYLACLLDRMNYPDWMLEMPKDSSMGYNKFDSWKRNLLQLGVDESGVWDARISGLSQIIELHVYADGEVEERLQASRLSDLYDLQWKTFPRMWED